MNLNMQCRLCRREVTGVVMLRVYTSEGIEVCAECYKDVERHRHRPYSKVMERLAMAEAGYRANRKRAKNTLKG